MKACPNCGTAIQFRTFPKDTEDEQECPECGNTCFKTACKPHDEANLKFALEVLADIARWNERDDQDLDACRMQWRGCVAVAKEAIDKITNA